MKVIGVKNYLLEVLVLVSVFLIILSWAYPSFIFESRGGLEKSLLGHDGLGSLMNISNSEYYFIIAINLIVNIGLLFKRDIFRWLFALILLFNYGSLLFLGYRVAPPFDNLIYAVIAFVDGMLFILVFQNDEK